MLDVLWQRPSPEPPDREIGYGRSRSFLSQQRETRDLRPLPAPKKAGEWLSAATGSRGRNRSAGANTDPQETRALLQEAPTPAPGPLQPRPRLYAVARSPAGPYWPRLALVRATTEPVAQYASAVFEGSTPDPSSIALWMPNVCLLLHAIRSGVVAK